MGRDDAVAFAERLARGCAEIFGEALVAAIVHGSLVLGNYRPGRSDVDLLVVAEQELTDGEIAALTELAAAQRAQAPARFDLRS
jgi:predicted nucleotidyltransferase